MVSTVSDTKRDYLLVDIGQYHILLPVSHIQIVLPIVALDEVPTSVESLKGILNYHGEAISTYDFGLLLGASEIKIHLDALVVLLELGDGAIGLIVNTVSDVLSICCSEIQKPVHCPLKPYFIGIYETAGESAWVLDIDKLLSDLVLNDKGIIYDKK